MAILRRVALGIWKSEYYFVVSYRNNRYNIIRHYGAPARTRTTVKEEEDFRVLQILPEAAESKQKKGPREVKVPEAREQKMSVFQDWTNVWPGPKTFHPASVPLPLRQGCMKNNRAPPGKYANAELMKIPNFLHLTKKAIKKHCEALRPFCTKWPKPLKDEAVQDKFFPLRIIHSDYCHSSPSIRDPLARIVSLQIKLSSLNLDKRARDKFLRLVGSRYNPKTDVVTITTDSCPLRGQNYDYAQYLLTALFYESRKYEDWEKEKGDEDMENYNFSQRQSLKNVKKVFDYNNRQMPDVTEYAAAVENWHDNGDQPETIKAYKKACLKLLNLPALD